MFNELYYLVDGGTLWGRPLSVGGLDGDEFDDDEDDEGEEDEPFPLDVLIRVTSHTTSWTRRW